MILQSEMNTKNKITFGTKVHLRLINWRLSDMENQDGTNNVENASPKS